MGQSCHRIFVDLPTVEVKRVLIPVKPMKLSVLIFLFKNQNVEQSMKKILIYKQVNYIMRNILILNSQIYCP